MENYNQPTQRDENRQSGTSQNLNEPNRHQQQEERERNVGTTGYGNGQQSGNQSGNDRTYNDGSAQRPNQYNSSPEDNELDDVEEEDGDMEDNDTGLDGMDDLDDDDERDSSATRQNSSSQRGNDFDSDGIF